ncbi:DUF302 domain-containing protein [Alicyclobacillus ferrooxydans]|uniref:DUF302 domain-containing protein n=1 Tax=Alicyclobacillus ferrooxydans TaxID=471514 RepID=A0A0P9EX60_9BACL|nr:DUF302 domain-containing protein [Alicyclobacillus ferrooxydans]KPV43711.1 hypothetical protein AN477_11175 [Alicyclobacillus ferrooxydans]
MFHYTVSTTKSLDEAIAALGGALKERSFGVLWELDMASKLHEKGVDYNGSFRVLEVCNPKVAKEVLEHNDLAGYFLPCKIVVYTDKNGSNQIGLTNPTALMSLVGDEKLSAIATDIEKTLKEAIDAAR